MQLKRENAIEFAYVWLFNSQNFSKLFKKKCDNFGSNCVLVAVILPLLTLSADVHTDVFFWQFLLLIKEKNTKQLSLFFVDAFSHSLLKGKFVSLAAASSLVAFYLL